MRKNGILDLQSNKNVTQNGLNSNKLINKSNSHLHSTTSKHSNQVLNSQVDLKEAVERKQGINMAAQNKIANDMIEDMETIKSVTKDSVTYSVEKENNISNITIDLLREEVILTHRPPKGTLSELIFFNKVNKIKEFIENNKNDINITDSIGETHTWTPLYWSVKLRRIECLQLLLEAGADMNLVINDSEECCGTVLDLATLREDEEIENILREYAEKEDVNLGQSFKAIRTKLRGKAPAFNFRYYGKNSQPQDFNNQENKKTA